MILFFIWALWGSFFLIFFFFSTEILQRISLFITVQIGFKELLDQAALFVGVVDHFFSELTTLAHGIAQLMLLKQPQLVSCTLA
jgi:hypothetical protein